MRALLAAMWLLPLVAIVPMVGCGGDEKTSDTFASEQGGAPSSSGVTASGSGSGSTASSTGGGSVVVVPPPSTATGGGSAMVDPNASCGKGMANASLSPVNMFIQFDRSTSMNEGNKWPQAAQALEGFFSDPQTAGLRVALRFFPHDRPVAGCGCDVNACSQPIVPLGELTKDPAPTDSQESLLVASVQNSAPAAAVGGGGIGVGATMSGGTPLYGALAGALAWARNQRVVAPNDKTVVVLVTDGQPNGCDENIDHIAQLAADALAQNQILTYAIGIAGASEAQMNQIALAGGTQHAYFAGNTSTAQQDLIDALNAIRGSSLSCDFALPTGPNVDPMLINVNFTPSGGVPEVIGQATDAQNCQNGGWYYDNPAMATRIVLCPSTCARAQSDANAKLEIVLGCKPVPVPPPK